MIPDIIDVGRTTIEAVEARKNAEERYYGEYSYSNSREGEEWKN